MKNSMFTLLISMLTLTLSASVNPPSEGSAFTIEAISFEMDVESVSQYDMDVNYLVEDEVLSFSLSQEVHFVQVLSEDGVLEYQLPVFSKNILIDLKDFESGEYALNLLIGKEKMVNSSFAKK